MIFMECTINLVYLPGWLLFSIINNHSKIVVVCYGWQITVTYVVENDNHGNQYAMCIFF